MNAPIGATLAGGETPSRPEAAGTPTRDLGKRSAAGRVAFPVYEGPTIPDYWRDSLRAMRSWIIERLGADRPAIEDAYETMAWLAMRETQRPLRWYELSLMRECVRDVLNARASILRRAP